MAGPGLKGAGKSQTPLSSQISTTQTKAPQAVASTTTSGEQTQHLVFNDLRINEKGMVSPNMSYFKGDQGRDFESDWTEAFLGTDGEIAPHGWIQAILVGLLEAQTHVLPEVPEVPDTYNNNFIVNYHSHITPMPIPLQGFITNIDITKTTEAPYESCVINLKTSFNFATALFAGDDGHPSPGGWILVRQKAVLNNDNSWAIDEGDITGTNGSEEIINQAAAIDGPTAPAVFFGTISELNYAVTPDENGNFECNITLVANSFIHNLIHGQFRTSAIVGKDQTRSIDNTFEDYTVVDDPNANSPVITPLKEGTPLDTIKGFESNRFMFNSKEWLNFMTAQIMSSQGKYIDEKGKFTVDGPRANNTDIMRNMMKFLGYPVLPLSLLAEPTDIEVFYKTFFQTFAETGTTFDNRLSLFQGLRGIQIPDAFVEVLLKGAVFILNAAVAENDQFKADQTTLGSGIPSADAIGQFTSWDKSIQTKGFFKRFTGRDATEYNYGSFIVGDSLEEFKQKFRDTFKQRSYYENMSLGDVIHIVGQRDDVPDNVALYPALPKFNIQDQDITHVKNLVSKGQTIWGLLRATFQTDPELIEFYPTMIPLKGYASLGVASYETATPLDDRFNYRSHPSANFWVQLGGIPAIVYRYKPLHPQLKGEISKEKIDKLNEYHQKLRRSTYLKEKMNYRTVTESFQQFTSTYGDETISIYNDNSYYELRKIGQEFTGIGRGDNFGPTYDKVIDRLQSISDLYAKKYGEDGFVVNLGDPKQFYRPELIRKEQIVSMNFRQDDTLRVNATHTSDPAMESSSGLLKYALTPSIVLNTPSAMKHGLRMYENVYPFFDLQTYNADSFEQIVKKIVDLVNGGASLSDALKQANSEGSLDSFPSYAIKATSCSERSYMLYGDEQKYFTGVITCKGTMSQEFIPGAWIEIDMAQYRQTRAPIDSNERFLLVYCTGVTKTHSVDQETGNVIQITDVTFERGSIGAVIPNFPTRKDFNLDDMRQELLGQAITKKVLLDAKGIRRSPQHTQLEPIVMQPTQTPSDTQKAVRVIRDQKYIDGAFLAGIITQEQRAQYLAPDEDGIPAGWPVTDMELINRAAYETLDDNYQDQVKAQLKGGQ